MSADPYSAIIVAARMALVADHFGKSTDEVVGEISRILRSGMLKAPQRA